MRGFVFAGGLAFALIAAPAFAQVPGPSSTTQSGNWYVGGYDSGPVTIGATPANASHSAGQSVAGLFTLALARTNGGSGILTSVGVKDTNNTPETYVLRIWSRNPTNTTCTDNSAFVSSATDDQYLIVGTPVSITTAAPATAVGDSNVYAALTGLAWDYQTSGNQNIYACLITVNTYTPGATKPIYLTVAGPQN